MDFLLVIQGIFDEEKTDDAVFCHVTWMQFYVPKIFKPLAVLIYSAHD